MPRIAVVDDDQALLSLLREVFAERDWTLCAHDTGEPVVPWLQHEAPDVILLALLLSGGVSGWDVLQQLIVDQALATIPVILFTGAIDRLREKEGWLEEHGIAILAKPFDLDDLYETIDAALHGRVNVHQVH